MVIPPSPDPENNRVGEEKQSNDKERSLYFSLSKAEMSQLHPGMLKILQVTPMYLVLWKIENRN